MLSLVVAIFGLAACGGSPPAEAPEQEAAAPSLGDALTLYASFDDGWDAAFAKGDRRVYFASSYKALDERAPGYLGTDIVTAPEGRFGSALHFKVKNDKALFYSGEENVAFAENDWSGTVSFWLKVDPANELAPGYCDPIQVTDSAYNDNAVWVDFTKDAPRQFRLGVFGEHDAWAEGLEEEAEGDKFDGRLVVVDSPPFSGEAWTHVAIAWSHVGTAGGRATLYLNGASQGSSAGIAEAVGWDMANASIRLGVNYVGMFDDLAVFDRELRADEVAEVYALEGGVMGLLN